MNSLTKKLQVKPGTNWLFFNAPPNYLPLIEPLPDGVKISYNATGVFDGIQIFIENSTQLASSLELIAPLLKPDTIFWITYPKKSSGIQSDLEMMRSWDEPAKYGLRIVTSISVDETWTALRFKPIEQTKTSDTNNTNIVNTTYNDYIDVKTKQVILPANIADILKDKPQAMAFYQQLSYSNKKEYVLWILTVKQEKTRSERLLKLVEKLQSGKKNPSEK